MKRILALILSLICCISCLIFPATAADTNTQPETEEILSVTRIDYPMADSSSKKLPKQIQLLLQELPVQKLEQKQVPDILQAEQLFLQ